MKGLYKIALLHARVEGLEPLASGTADDAALLEKVGSLPATDKGESWGDSIQVYSSYSYSSASSSSFTPTVEVELPSEPGLQGRRVKVAIAGVLQYPVEGLGKTFDIKYEPVMFRTTLDFAATGAWENYDAAQAAASAERDAKWDTQRKYSSAAENPAQVVAIGVRWLALVCFGLATYFALSGSPAPAETDPQPHFAAPTNVAYAPRPARVASPNFDFLQEQDSRLPPVRC